MKMNELLDRNIKVPSIPLNLIKSGKFNPDRIDYKRVLKEKQNELKQLGVNDIQLEGIDPRVAFETASQLCRLIKHYGFKVQWFGVTQTLYDKQYEGSIEYNTNESIRMYRKTEEVARKEALLYTKKKNVGDKDYAYNHINFQIYDKSRYKLIHAITLNSTYARSYNTLSSSLDRDVEIKYHPPFTNTPSAIISHEYGHVLHDLLGASNSLDKDVDKSLRSIFSTRSSDLSIYATYEFEEFIAEAFAESHHSPKPREIALLVRKWIDDGVATFIRKNPNSSVAATGPAPKFVESEWFVPEPNNWHLKDGAPPQVVQEFNKFIESEEKKNKQTVNIECNNK